MSQFSASCCSAASVETAAGPFRCVTPLVEFATGCVTAYAGWYFGFFDGQLTPDSLLRAVAAAVFSWYLIALALIDYDTQLLPDSMTMPLLWIGITLSFFGVFAARFGYRCDRCNRRLSELMVGLLGF